LISKLKKREEPIKKEIKMHQDKIKSIETESSKCFQRKRADEKEFQKVKERLEQISDRVSVLNQTYETLRVNVHTLKQTYKMKSLSVVLKKKSAMYHLDQKQRQSH
jgi:predicted nuclease with TOPRIM domain